MNKLLPIGTLVEVSFTFTQVNNRETITAVTKIIDYHEVENPTNILDKYAYVFEDSVFEKYAEEFDCPANEALPCYCKLATPKQIVKWRQTHDKPS